jgi:hypothetical protein
MAATESNRLGNVNVSSNLNCNWESTIYDSGVTACKAAHEKNTIMI